MWRGCHPMISKEQGLLRRFVLHDDAAAFAGLSSQYGPLVYRVCWRILRDEDKAADATQETFLQLVRHAHKIHGSVVAWLHRVATGKAIDIIRKDRRHREFNRSCQADFREEPKSWGQLSLQIDEALNLLDVQYNPGYGTGGLETSRHTLGHLFPGRRVAV